MGAFWQLAVSKVVSPIEFFNVLTFLCWDELLFWTMTRKPDVGFISLVWLRISFDVCAFR